MMPRETRKRKLRDTGGTEIQLYDCLLDGYLQDQLLQWFGSIVDITNLALTSKAFYAMTRCHTPLYKTIAARNLGPLVQNFGFRDTQHFDNFLDSTDLTLSGSLMLQCLLGILPPKDPSQKNSRSPSQTRVRCEICRQKLQPLFTSVQMYWIFERRQNHSNHCWLTVVIRF